VNSEVRARSQCERNLGPGFDSRTGLRGLGSITVLALAACLCFLWLCLIKHLSFEWTYNPQYAYGWAVPGLCAYLCWRDLRIPKGQPQSTEASTSRNPGLTILFVLALSYAATRFIAEANPDWRLASWALAVEVVGFTVLFLPGLFRYCAFPRPLQSVVPVVFFLVALPWPSLLERQVVRVLTKFVTMTAAEFLEIAGQPVLYHGNVIEVGAGAIGVDEACSGIRSLQTALMLGVFVGEVYRLGMVRRCVLISVGVLSAIGLNVMRAAFLAWMAARSGLNGMASWHGLAGVLIPMCSFCAIWALAMAFRHSKSNREGRGERSFPKNPCFGFFEPASGFAAGLCLWVFAVELSTEGWFRQHERHLPQPVCWTVKPPPNEPDFANLALAPSAHEILRFDESIAGRWSTTNGLNWQMTFLRWSPGGIAARLARNHTPQDCLSAIGATVSGPQFLSATVSDMELPFQRYQVAGQRGVVYVFFCLWEDRGAQRTFGREWLTYRNRLAAVLAGRRNSGSRSLELVLWGADNEQSAQEQFEALLKQIVRLQS
jgi:exosortase